MVTLGPMATIHTSGYEKTKLTCYFFMFMIFILIRIKFKFEINNDELLINHMET